MTNDKQIEAVVRAIYQWWMDDMPLTGNPKVSYEQDASYAQYVPMLVEVLSKVTADRTNKSVGQIVREALANLPEELRG